SAAPRAFAPDVFTRELSRRGPSRRMSSRWLPSCHGPVVGDPGGRIVDQGALRHQPGCRATDATDRQPDGGLEVRAELFEVALVLDHVGPGDPLARAIGPPDRRAG